jgi:hypothetical protein
MKLCADDYLSLIGDWQDPNPAPVIETHEGIRVVRDDLLDYGSKIRSVDYLIGHDVFSRNVEEWVFGGCPATGYAQISLPYVANRYGKRVVLFMAKRSMDKLHPYQQRSLELGADIRWVPMGFLNVTKARARDYVAENPKTRRALPLGLEDPTVIASMIRVARSLDFTPSEVWSVGSSGTLSRSLQLAWPDAAVHVVSVGHQMQPHEIGRATHYRSPYKFDQAVPKHDAPPFPSAPTYDAKAWAFVRKHASEGSLFWNVGA